MSIVVIGTLDTKGVEVGFVRDQIVRAGCSTLVIDTGTFGNPAIESDVSRERVARASGETFEQLLATGDKARIQNAMTDGLVNIVLELYAKARWTE